MGGRGATSGQPSGSDKSKNKHPGRYSHKEAAREARELRNWLWRNRRYLNKSGENELKNLIRQYGEPRRGFRVSRARGDPDKEWKKFLEQEAKKA